MPEEEESDERMEVKDEKRCKCDNLLISKNLPRDTQVLNLSLRLTDI